MRTPVLVAPLLAVLSLALGQSAYSAFTIGTIDVDFNGSVASPVSATGAAVIGSVGDTWNTFTGAPTGMQALNLTTGASSGVNLQISGPAYITGTSPGANGPNAGLTQDFLAVAGSGMQIKMGTITLTNLTALQGYQLYLYNGSTSIGRITDFSVAGTTTVTGSINNMGSPGAGSWTPAVAILPANYLQLNATADSGGKLVIQFMNRAASEGDFAGFQIRAIPEPSTYALLLAGTATLLIVGYRARCRASAK
jgi:hypothetical protein